MAPDRSDESVTGPLPFHIATVLLDGTAGVGASGDRILVRCRCRLGRDHTVRGFRFDAPPPPQTRGDRA